MQNKIKVLYLHTETNKHIKVMPNWVNSCFSLQGSKDTIHNFIKLGLTNSNLETSNDIEKDFEKLLKKATTKTVIGKGTGKEVNDLTDEIFLSMRTFRPSPDTFLKYDTTNYAEFFKEEADKQRAEYGVVGWYDYNCLTLGTKWNAELTDCSLRAFDENPNYYRFDFCLDTAWNFPAAWCRYIKEKFPDIVIKFYSIEESNCFHCFGFFEEEGENVYDISEVRNLVFEHNSDIREAKESELEEKLDAGEIDQDTYDNEMNELSCMEYEVNFDEDSPYYSQLWDLIDKFDDDFNDFCELDGTLEPYLETLAKLLEENEEI